MKRITPIFVFSVIANFQVFSAVDFNREVRPLLASKCYACHGPDEEGRKAKLRLDVREDALKNDVIVPGKVEDSEFHYRIHSDEQDEIMPPPESHTGLTQQEKELLDRWIKEGAKYDKHWAFVKPVSPKVPTGQKGWVRNPIDAFISNNLSKNDLNPVNSNFLNFMSYSSLSICFFKDLYFGPPSYFLSLIYIVGVEEILYFF